MGVEDLLATFAGYLITGALCLLAGCTLGYWTAMKDMAKNVPEGRSHEPR